MRIYKIYLCNLQHTLDLLHCTCWIPEEDVHCNQGNEIKRLWEERQLTCCLTLLSFYIVPNLTRILHAWTFAVLLSNALTFSLTLECINKITTTYVVVITTTFKRLVHVEASFQFLVYVYLSDTRIYYTFDFNTHLCTTFYRGGKPTSTEKLPRVIKHFAASNFAGDTNYAATHAL